MRCSATFWIGLALLSLIDSSAGALSPSIQFFEASPIALSGSGRQVLFSNVKTDQPLATYEIYSSVSALWDRDDRSYSFLLDENGTGLGIGFSDLSSDGTTVVGGTGFRRLGGGETGPLRWRADSGFEQLEKLDTDPLAPYFYSGLRTSGDGTTVIGASRDASLFRPIPSLETQRWNAAGNLENPIEDPSNHSTLLLSLSEDGQQFAGYQQTEREGRLVSEAIRWTEAGGTKLILPETLSALSSSASVLSGDGRVAFGTYRENSPEFARVFVQDAENGFVDLKQLLPEAFQAEILSANHDGSSAVGNAHFFGRAEHSFEYPSEAILWKRAGGTRTLAEILEGLGVDLKGAKLNSAIDISADGKHILGRTSDGFAFVATIPEPSPALLIGLGLAGLCATSNRFSKQHSLRKEEPYAPRSS